MQRNGYESYDDFVRYREKWLTWKRLKEYANIAAFGSALIEARAEPTANILGRMLKPTVIKELSSERGIEEAARQISQDAETAASIDVQYFQGKESDQSKWVVVIRAADSRCRRVVAYAMDARLVGLPVESTDR